MHLQLRKHLGDTVADTLVEHLPPTGWGDVARKSDLDQLRAEMNSRFKGLSAGMWAMTSIFSACFIALFTILATRL